MLSFGKKRAMPAHLTRMETLSTREVILNLWFVQDDEGFIYSLRVKPYVMEGEDSEKLNFLQQRAKLDYLIAESFPGPERTCRPGLSARLTDFHM